MKSFTTKKYKETQKTKTLKKRKSESPNINCEWTESDGDMAIMGRLSNTDKITHHGYYRFYPRFLEHYRNISNCAILEIGVENEFSIKLWLDYFPQAFIYGIDINLENDGERFKIMKADQSSLTQLQKVKRQIDKDLFFIIDDGSHIPQHQILTFNYFFPLLMTGGTYIIEDIETSYWSRGGLYGYKTNYGYHNSKSVVEFFKFLIDDINTEFLKPIHKKTQSQIVDKFVSKLTRSWISSITFAQNCIIILKKTEEEKMLFDNRKYRFESRL